MSDGQNSLHLAMNAKFGVVLLFNVPIALPVFVLTCVNFGVWLVNVSYGFTGVSPENSGLSLFNVPVALQGFCFPCPLLT